MPDTLQCNSEVELIDEKPTSKINVGTTVGRINNTSCFLKVFQNQSEVSRWMRAHLNGLPMITQQQFGLRDIY